MFSPDMTLVVGADDYHLRQLSVTWPTWKRHKPSLLNHPMVIFFDHEQVNAGQVFQVIDHPDLLTVPWPPPGVHYPAGEDKWSNQQRYRMLAGFVHVPAAHVQTKYWLKLDTDTVATGQNDWIKEEWFEDNSAIVAQGWGYTKPPDQMMKLDQWVEQSTTGMTILKSSLPLNLIPEPGADKLRHKRIISWCGFFSRTLSMAASKYATTTCGVGHLPVPSQDGFMFYLATRLKMPVNRVDMKKCGFEHWGCMSNIEAAAEMAMRNV